MSNGKTSTPPAALILLSGLPGSGKTTFAHALMRRLPARHIESDAVRHELYRSPRYVGREHRRVFDAVERRAATALRRRHCAIIDATNLTMSDRARFIALARRMGVVLVVVRVVAPEAVLRERLSRPREGWSGANLRVLEEMRGRPEPFTLPVVVIDSHFGLTPSLDLVVRLATGGVGA